MHRCWSCGRVLADNDKVLAKVKNRTFHDSVECSPVYFGRGTGLVEDVTADFVMPEVLAKRLQMRGVEPTAA